MEGPGYHFTSQLRLHKDCPDPASEGAEGITSPETARRRNKCWSSCELSAFKTGPSPDPAEHEGNIRQSRGKGAVQSVIPGWLYTVTTSILNVPMHVPRNGIFFE